MLLHEGRRPPPFDQPGWFFELKFDGYRLLAGVNRGAVTLGTRGGNDATTWFPELVRGLATIRGGVHVIDGEVCVLDDLGRSDFDRLRVRASRRRWYEGADRVVFCAFDLLKCDGEDLTQRPIEDRKERLARLLTPVPPSVLFVGHFNADDGRRLFQQARALRLEGLVAKRLGSSYRPGERSEYWIKCKIPGSVPPERFR
jgi:bifunctional non-homologous end joining protein LigD